MTQAEQRTAYPVVVPGPDEHTVMMYAPEPAQWAVFSRLMTQMTGLQRLADLGRLTPEKAHILSRAVGAVMSTLDNLLVSDDDKRLIDTLMIGGELSAANAMQLILEAQKAQIPDQAADAKPARAVTATRKK